MTIALPARSMAQLVENADSPAFEIHVNVASQVDLATLQAYLEDARLLVHGTQQPSDVACCSTLDATSLPSFGNANDGLDVINSQSDWNRLGNSGAFIVQSILWCGTPGASIVGCGLTPGNKFAIALDAATSIRGVVIAHERGHNAGLAHRSNESCALMFATAASTHGCLTASECTSIRNLGSPGGACPCHGASVGDPPLDGASCDDGDGCTQTDTCQDGLCSGANPLVCTPLDPCHDAGLCDSGTGLCSDPAKPDGTLCDDGDPATPGGVCHAGACAQSLPVPTVGPLGRGIIAVGLAVTALVAGARTRSARRSARSASASRL